MKFLERHWWVILAIVILYLYATRQTPLGDTLGDDSSSGPSSGVTGSYGSDTPSIFNFPAWLGFLF
jgi:hypothetical protein